MYKTALPLEHLGTLCYNRSKFIKSDSNNLIWLCLSCESCILCTMFSLSIFMSFVTTGHSLCTIFQKKQSHVIIKSTFCSLLNIWPNVPLICALDKRMETQGFMLITTKRKPCVFHAFIQTHGKCTWHNWPCILVSNI